MMKAWIFNVSKRLNNSQYVERGNSIFSAINLEGSEGIFSSADHEEMKCYSKYGESLLYGNFHFTFVAMYFFIAPNLAMIQIGMI